MYAVRSRFPRVVPIALLACALAVGASAQQASRRPPTPVPSVTGPIPVTDTSHPYMSAAHLLEPMDLAATGRGDVDVAQLQGVYALALGDECSLHARSSRVLPQRACLERLVNVTGANVPSSNEIGRAHV